MAQAKSKEAALSENAIKVIAKARCYIAGCHREEGEVFYIEKPLEKLPKHLEEIKEVKED